MNLCCHLNDSRYFAYFCAFRCIFKAGMFSIYEALDSVPSTTEIKPKSSLY